MGSEKIEMKKLEISELQKLTDEIISCEAFELHKISAENGTQDYYIPYMMNDALECFLILKNGRMVGTYEPENGSVVKAEVLKEENNTALILYQDGGFVCTLWFSEGFQELKCYRYDRIGHFWVAGQEHWRRLVYIIGTIHDKYNYMGESVCSELEMQLLPLMEFAPFRAFSPIRESLDDYYRDSEEGYRTMLHFAEEAGDTAFLRLLRWYRLPLAGKYCAGIIKAAMMRPGRQALYQTLFAAVEKASSSYPERTYEAALEEQKNRARERVSLNLKGKGFEGDYPLFQKAEEKKHIQILAMEEHPFTILESDKYRFRIQLMISETEGSCARGLNSGFFRKKGNFGWISDEV